MVRRFFRLYSLQPAIPQANSVRDLNQLGSDLEFFRGDVIKEGKKIFDRWQKDIKWPSFLVNAENLAHYLALRHRDLRKLQMDLADYGLSSLGRSEGRVLPNIDSVIGSINGPCGLPNPVSYPSNNNYLKGVSSSTRFRVLEFAGWEKYPKRR